VLRADLGQQISDPSVIAIPCRRHANATFSVPSSVWMRIPGADLEAWQDTGSVQTWTGIDDWPGLTRWQGDITVPASGGCTHAWRAFRDTSGGTTKCTTCGMKPRWERR
jgi:hypothetical protein